MIERSVQRLLVGLLGGVFETEEYRIVLTDTSVLMRPKEGGEDVVMVYSDIERITIRHHVLNIKTAETVKFFKLSVDKTPKKV